MSESMTWKQVREDVNAAHESAEAAYAAIGDNLMHGATQADAMYDLTEALRAARDDLRRLSWLLEDSDEPERPARPLEAVLADIEALGFRYSISPRDVTTYLDAVGAGKDGSQWNTTWLRETSGGDVVAGAEVELTRIRDLYAAVVALVETLSYRPEPARDDFTAFVLGAAAESIGGAPSPYDNATHVIAETGFVHIEDGQNGRYAVGERHVPGASQNPWKVVDQKPGEAPAIVFEFAYRLEAEDCRDALNTGAFTPLMDMDPEVEPITGPTDAEEAALAREDARRVTAASEEDAS